ncbi:low affinity iron permease family protein [Ottowia sp. GY511]|uniref:Low affinity iron permease family protein n=1 Tax=Ottowia flava TaxID=2675430 RepID=A0ABW4KRV2_9BURK|nr:low affinity iron permease family protein [Ottowia sp. GY511]TXK24909.1 low affinity iron permease family protein [Ottowia sp. GY511]
MAISPTVSHPRSRFARVSRKVSRIAGHSGSFVLACALVLIWAVTGPFFHFSETWQLVINTGTTIVTFLMVFLIQGSQNTETEALLQIKLDELIRAVDAARNRMLVLEDLDEAELDALRGQFVELAAKDRGEG